MKHKTPVQIRFGDVDLMGHVNHAVFLTYMELARIRYFNDVVGMQVNWSETGFIVAKVTVDFFSPLLLNDEEVTVLTGCTRFGNKSFDLSYTLLKSNDGAVAANGITTLVAYNYKTRKTIPIPDEWKNKIRSYEGNGL